MDKEKIEKIRFKETLFIFELLFAYIIYQLFGYFLLVLFGNNQYWFDYTFIKILFLCWIFTGIWFIFALSSTKRKKHEIEKVFVFLKLICFITLNFTGFRFGLFDSAGWLDGGFSLICMILLNYFIYARFFKKQHE